MNNSRKSIFIPSIADIVFLSVFLLLSFSAGKGLLADCDTGYHIRAGEFILDTFSIPKQDIFSFLSPPLYWTAHEWLSEVIMALLHRAFGMTGVVIFFSFIIAAVYYLLLRGIQTYKGNIFLTLLVVLLVVGASQIHWLARPHIFSLFLVVIWYYLLDSYQYRDKNHLYLLPLIMLLWVNLHGGFIAAFILSGIYLFYNLARLFISQGEEKADYKKKAKILGAATFACLLVSLINPYGYHILLFPFRLTSDRILMDNVLEFLSPNFHEPLIFKYLLLSAIAVLALSGKRLNLIELGLILLFTYMSLYSARYIPLFGIIAAPILTRQAEYMLQSEGRLAGFFKKRAERISPIDASAKGYLWPVAAVLAVIILAATGRVEYGFDEKIKPVAAVEFLKKEHLEGNMFNSDEFGDYIIYIAYPHYKVFIDGRLDMYGSERIKEYFKVARIEAGLYDVLKKHNINWIIFDARSALSQFLIQRDDWKLIYADKVANIFLRNIPENRKLIEKYKSVRPALEEKEKEPPGS